MSKRFVNRALSGSWRLVFLIYLIWQLSTPVLAQAQPQVPPDTKNILVLHALESNMPLNVRTDRAIVAALEAGGIAMRNQFFEYLDLQPMSVNQKVTVHSDHAPRPS